MGKFYDGTKLLSMKDINGDRPEIYMTTTNRTGGKTVWFSRYCVKQFLKSGEKFMIVYRYKNELDDCAGKFFKDIERLFFRGMVMKSKSKAMGAYHELFLDDKSCGYAVALNGADKLKKMSHLFSDTTRMFFDEFQSETNDYCPNEIEKLISIHTSVARGGGEQVRYVPLYMCANPVSLINPYYVELGIANRLKSDTKFIKGEGFVLEQGYVESASEAQRESGFNRAFAKNKYTMYSGEGLYLNDNLAFIEKPKGASRYLATLRYKGCDYALRSFEVEGVIYCDDKADNTFPNKITVTTEDHNINYVMLRSNDLFISNMRYFFEKGCFRFKNLQCKEAVMCALSY